MTTNVSKFKIQGVGIDTSSITEKPWIESGGEIFDYIHTSIRANNDFLLKEYVGSQPGASLITTIDFFDNPERAILGHVMELGRNKVDLLLVPGNVLSKKLGVLKDTVDALKHSSLIGELGISNPSSPDEIKEISGALGEKIKYISLNLCPLHFNYDVIEYAKGEGIDILGFNPFGGSLSAEGIIQAFTVPYLLSFAGSYSTILFLSGRDLFRAIDGRDYLRRNVIGAESSSKFTLKKSVNRLYKPLKKVVNTSLMFSDNIILSYDSPGIMYPPDEVVVTLGKEYELIPRENKYSITKTEDSVNSLLDITEFPNDGDWKDKYAIVRYQILGLLRSLYPEEDGWKMNLIPGGDRVLGIGLVRETREKPSAKIFKGKKITESLYFLLYINSEGTVMFVENPDLKFTPEEA